MTKSELILFKSKTKYFLDILYNERFNIYSEIRFGLFYNFRRYMDDRIHIVHQSKTFIDQYFLNLIKNDMLLLKDLIIKQ